MKLQRMLSLLRQAIDQYHLIQEGDRIAVGLSGGKDSMAMLYAMNELKRFYPEHFELCAISVDLGLEGFDTGILENYCDKLGIPLYIVNTQIGPILFEERKEKNPCSLCAKMRKGALNGKALELGCNKIAYAHHQDDVIETLFLSMFYEGGMYTLEPRFTLDQTNLTIIRPMIYVSEAEVIGFKNKYGLPVAKNPCPADGNTRREFIKNHIRKLRQDVPDVKKHIFHSIEAMWKKEGLTL